MPPDSEEIPFLDAFDFELPPDLIAQSPPAERDAGRMLEVERSGDGLRDRRVRDFPECLGPGDLLVVNTTRVRPARLRGTKATGGAAECLLLETRGAGNFEALVRCRGKLREGLKFLFGDRDLHFECEISEVLGDGRVVLGFPEDCDPYTAGEMPLPPYIQRDSGPDPRDRNRYQTVFAHEPGAVAAPTAGLHLSELLLAQLAERGVERAEVVLHVGAGTFRPLGERELQSGRLHRERYVLPEATVAAVEATRRRGGRVVAVGTTTTRVLESCADAAGRLAAGAGETELFLRPGDPFRVVDALLTNFHLPRSSLLLLVAAFAGRERILRAYEHAVDGGYRFFSYGDAMWIH